MIGERLMSAWAFASFKVTLIFHRRGRGDRREKPKTLCGLCDFGGESICMSEQERNYGIYGRFLLYAIS